MRAVCMPRPGTVEIRELPRPVRKEGETLLRLRMGGICGSDLGSYRGKSAYMKYPNIIGHEFAAEVVETDSPDLHPGQLVTANPYFNCGKCYSCRRGFVHCCINNQTMGVQREGAFADYVAVPTERVYDGTGIEPRELALVEPFCISHHGVSRAEIRAGERVLVMGGGAIGILAALTAHLQGAKVWLCDIAKEKLDFIAGNFPVDGVILNEGPAALEEAGMRITEGDGFDVTVEAAGVPESFVDCCRLAASRGRLIQIGVSANNADFPFLLLQKKELTAMGSRAATKADFMKTMEYVRSGKAELSKLISKTYPMSEAPEAFQDLDAHAGSYIKMELAF